MPTNAMTTYQFTCPDCTQVIEVDGAMREMIEEQGCPVCTSPVAASSFEQI